MKKLIVIILLLFSGRSQAQYQIVTTLVKKVIKAIDLKVQRMQNETIWLQNAQKTIDGNTNKFDPFANFKLTPRVDVRKEQKLLCRTVQDLRFLCPVNNIVSTKIHFLF